MLKTHAKYHLGQVVRHKKHPFRGVIFDVDAMFSNTDEWYEAIPEDSRPSKDQPFYHLLAENDQSYYVAYVSEQNLVEDYSGEPVNHPDLDDLFGDFEDGHYPLHFALNWAFPIPDMKTPAVLAGFSIQSSLDKNLGAAHWVGAVTRDTEGSFCSYEDEFRSAFCPCLGTNRAIWGQSVPFWLMAPGSQAGLSGSMPRHGVASSSSRSRENVTVLRRPSRSYVKSCDSS